MKFVDFINEHYIEEAAISPHGKVEMSIRELGLEYTTKTENTGKMFLLDNGFIVMSRNNGNVSLHRHGIKGEIASVFTLEFDKIRELVTNMLKAKLPAIKSEEHVKPAKTGVAKRLRRFA